MARKLTAAQGRALKHEATEWDKLSDQEFANLFDEGEPVKIRLRRPPPKVLSVALDERTLNRLKRIARHKQIQTRDLAAMWIAERLAKENRAQR